MFPLTSGYAKPIEAFFAAIMFMFAGVIVFGLCLGHGGWLCHMGMYLELLYTATVFGAWLVSRHRWGRVPAPIASLLFWSWMAVIVVSFVLACIGLFF